MNTNCFQVKRNTSIRLHGLLSAKPSNRTASRNMRNHLVDLRCCVEDARMAWVTSLWMPVRQDRALHASEYSVARSSLFLMRIKMGWALKSKASIQTIVYLYEDRIQNVWGLLAVADGTHWHTHTHWQMILLYAMELLYDAFKIQILQNIGILIFKRWLYCDCLLYSRSPNKLLFYIFSLS